MVREAQTFLKQLVRIIDGVAIVLAFLWTYNIRQNYRAVYKLDMVVNQPLSNLKDLGSYLWLLLLILPIWLCILHALGAYRELRVKSSRQIVPVLFKANVLALLSLSAFVFLLKLDYVSRTFMGMFFIASFIMLCFERACLIEIWRMMAKRDHFQRNILIVGTGKRAQALIQSVHNHKNWGLHLVGLLDPDPVWVGKEVAGVPIIGALYDLPKILQEHVIDEVIFSVPRNWMSLIEEGVLHCEHVGVRATVATDLFNIRFAKAQPTEMDGIPLVSFQAVPAGEWQLAIKRFADIIMSLAGLIVLLPFFPVVALAIKLTSKGPIFFTQTRVGLNGRLFKLYKFRSMVVDAEARQAQLWHLNEMGGPVFKITKDPRMTPIGNFLRKTSIDELPQLLNVLRGEISLIGPRPPIPQEVAKYEPWQRRRLSMRPGITGYWQVNGRSQIKDFDQWMRLDLAYIDRWSLFFDMQIIFKTIPVVLLGTGAK